MARDMTTNAHLTTLKRLLPRALIALTALLLAACGSPGAQPTAFRATVAAVTVGAPVYTATPTLTLTPTPTPTATLTPTLTPTFTATPTLTPTRTPSPSPTPPLASLTPVVLDETRAPRAAASAVAPLSATEGWSCGDFPCEDDLAGFLRRIQVPPGYAVEPAGRFSGQPQQITVGPDGRLYATVLENGTLTGAVHVLDADGTGSTRYSLDTLYSPYGLAFQPGTDTLYVSARTTPTAGGALWRILPDGRGELVIDDLPCCFDVVGSQANGLIFGPDGYLYMGLGALTDKLEPPFPERMRYAEIDPLEASILRIQPHTGAVEVYARGLHNPMDIAFDSSGQFYATDSGLLDGIGDRILRISAAMHYGWPYYRPRGCDDCPPTDFSITITPDLLALPDYTLPRGLTVYTGSQFPREVFDSLFVALWNGTDGAQRIIRLDPRSVPTDPDALAEFTPEPFMTGLIRPIDVIVDHDGALLVADFVYGHVWRVVYTGNITVPTPAPLVFATNTPAP